MSATALVLGASIYSITARNYGADLRDDATSLVRTAASLMDMRSCAEVVQQCDPASESFQRTRAWLVRYCAVNPAIRSIGVIRAGDEAVCCTVDANRPVETQRRINDVFTRTTRSIHAFFQRPDEVLVEPEPTEDREGTFLAAYAPIRDSGGLVVGALRLDVDAGKVAEAESNIWWTILNGSRLTLLGILAGSFLLASRMSAPLVQLAGEVQRIQDFDLSGETGVRSSFREIALVGGAIQSMKMSLRSFKKFVASDLVSDLLSLSREAKLGTEKRELTLLFSDIVDFTTISERLSSQQLEQNMGEYFGSMLYCIKEHAGTIDKFIGDAVMAFWNAPRKCRTHAVQACHAALSCRREVHRINQRLQAGGYPPFHTRFGLNTGECIVGNMGTEDRMSYTAIGDTVNLASRIEAINKLYGTEILVSESTYWQAKDVFAFRTVDRVVVKGKTAQVQIYELVDARANMSAEDVELVLKHNEAMNLYFSGAFELARAYFETQLAQRPGDALTRNIISRLDERIAAPPSTQFRPVHLRSN
jgi:adenylate cyclase